MDESILPNDIQEDILLRLPLKYLVACSFTCKKWKTMICDENFKRRYLERTTLMLSTTSPTPHSFFHAVCSPERGHIISAPIRGWVSVDSGPEQRLYNPMTKEILHLPKSIGCEELYPSNGCLFGYDEANGVFKVLGFFSSSFAVYSTVRPGSGGEGSWRPIACEHPHYHASPFHISDDVDLFAAITVTNALCKGGVLYYVARTLPDYTHRLMSFNVNSEEFTIIPSPEGFIVDHRCIMVNFNGKIALLNNPAAELESTGGFQICVRNEDSGQWVPERVEIPGWRTTAWSKFLFSFVGTIGSAEEGELVFTSPDTVLGESVKVFHYKKGKEITPVTLEGANKDTYHYVRACLNHFECLLRA